MLFDIGRPVLNPGLRLLKRFAGCHCPKTERLAADINLPVVWLQMRPYRTREEVQHDYQWAVSDEL